MIKLSHYKDKQLILARARSNLKNTSVYINDDFSDFLNESGREGLSYYDARQEQEEITVLSAMTAHLWGQGVVSEQAIWANSVKQKPSM